MGLMLGPVTARHLREIGSEHRCVNFEVNGEITSHS